MSATIKDVAKAAGVSVATVSRVLNGTSNVSEATKDAVNKAIKELRYSPNFLGRNLRKRETDVILVIKPSSLHSLYAEIIEGMQDEALRHGYTIVAATSNGIGEIEDMQMNMLFNRTVDGAVLLGTHKDAATINKLAESFDIALCCEGVEGANVLTVTVDDEQATYDAVTALIKKGHRKIAMVSAGDIAMSSILREEGYFRALKENNIPFREEYLYRGDYTCQNGETAVRQFMALDDKPTAVITVSDLMAVAAIRTATEMGMNIGENLSVIGFDNIAMCEMYAPSVSTVSQPCREMGRLTIKKLISNIRSDTKDTGYYTMPHEVVLRQSTGD